MTVQNTTPDDKSSALKRGWTTGACATAATKAALGALLGEGFADPVQIELPGGQRPDFALAFETLQAGIAAEVGIVKDAGDDPDVTHGATIISRVSFGTSGSGILFKAGDGVGTVTKPGLPIDVGEAAINPVPREMMRAVVETMCARHHIADDFTIELRVPNGAKIAQKTWNPRLGILGGLSILGTTGIVIPYSCSAWIHSIHRGIDVARAMGLNHIVGATGDRSEQAAKAALGLANECYIDMGDFVGGMLKYARQNRVARITIAGGFAKICKLAQGAMDLHSARASLDIDQLAGWMGDLGATDDLVDQAKAAQSGAQVLQLSRAHKLELGNLVANKAKSAAERILKDCTVDIDIIVIDRQGEIVGRAPNGST